jgi:hypothetical protein
MWLKRWRRRLNKWSELAEADRRARRGGEETRARELAAVRDILYKDMWFRIATAIYAHLKRQFAEDGEAAEVIEAAERRLYGLKLEVVEAPLLKIEAAVDQDGKIAAVRCKAALDVGVETVFMGVAPGYRLERRLRQARQQMPAQQRTSNAEAAERRRRALSVEVPRCAATRWSVLWRR